MDQIRHFPHAPSHASFLAKQAEEPAGKGEGTLMSTMVELPLWLVLLATVPACIGLIDRLLMPTVRWFFRARINRAIDELNARLRLRIQPFKLTQRASLVDRLIYDQELIKAARAHAETVGEPYAVTMARVQSYAREIVPTFNAYAYFKIGARAARWLSTLLYRVRLGYADDEGLKKIDPDSTVIFVMNHRSNMDYVLVTYMASASSALSYAVGEWARVFPLQNIIRSMGAYFIRRDSGDPLYRKVLARYVQLSTAEGVTQAMFPEGGLTRDGALRPAKLGLLSYLVARFDPEAERDVVFVPVGLNYDRVLEDRNLTAQIVKDAGMPNQRVRGFRLAKYVGRAIRLSFSRRWYRYGYAAVSFGAPVSLREWTAREKIDFRKLDDETRFAVVGKLGQELMAEVGRVIPVLPVVLIATVFRQAGDEALSEIELKSRTEALMEALTAKGVHVHVPRGDRDYAVSAGLRMLTLRRLVLEQDGLFTANPKESVLIAYYANSIAHHVAGLADQQSGRAISALPSGAPVG
ncbi:MAG: 1-acyl-sn-glycerol-3-phosphate acyltransferase [Bosea sp. (in: a-proteobacteria)]